MEKSLYRASLLTQMVGGVQERVKEFFLKCDDALSSKTTQNALSKEGTSYEAKIATLAKERASLELKITDLEKKMQENEDMRSSLKTMQEYVNRNSEHLFKIARALDDFLGGDTPVGKDKEFYTFRRKFLETASNKNYYTAVVGNEVHYTATWDNEWRLYYDDAKIFVNGTLHLGRLSVSLRHISDFKDTVASIEGTFKGYRFTDTGLKLEKDSESTLFKFDKLQNEVDCMIKFLQRGKMSIEIDGQVSPSK